MKKRIFSLLLCLTMILAMLPSAAFASGEETGDIAEEPNGVQESVAAEEVKVSGIVSWSDVVLPEGTSAVKIIGDGVDTVIEFPEVTDFDRDITFDNVEIKAAGTDAKIFANGYRLVTTSTVTTSGGVWVYGGGNERSIDGDTYLWLDGGDYSSVVGGSYSQSVDSDNPVYVKGTSTVYIGKDATAYGVVSGCVGGVNYGDISVTYASQKSGNAFITGSSADAAKEGTSNCGLTKSMAKVQNVGGSISVMIPSGAIAGNIYATLFSTVDLGTGSVSVTVEPEAEVEIIYGSYGVGATSVTNNVGIYTGADYYQYGDAKQKQNYHVAANIDITMNGVATAVVGAYYTDIVGNVDIKMGGTAIAVCGGAYRYGSVDGDVQVTVSGTITDNESNGNTLSCVVGGCWGDYIDVQLQNTSAPNLKVNGNVLVTICGNASVPLVYGGGLGSDYNGNYPVAVSVGKDVTVVVKDNAIITGSSQRASVYGGGYRSAVGGDCTVRVTDSAKVSASKSTAIYGAGSTSTVAGDSNVEIMGNSEVSGARTDAIYCGAYYGTVTGNTNLVVKDSAYITQYILGGGYGGTVSGNTTVKIADNAVVETVVGSGIKEAVTKGTATVYVKDNAQVNGTIYGEYGELAVEAKTSIIFDNCEGQYSSVLYADLVLVTNNSDVILDKSGDDNKQIVSIQDLIVDNGGKLTLLASAEVKGNYTGETFGQDIIEEDAAEGGESQEDGSSSGDIGVSLMSLSDEAGDSSDAVGTLAIAAGKTLTVGGRIAGQTNLSILDNDDTVPAAGQAYVVSAAGSTDEIGKFTWVDQRNNIALDWKSNEDVGSESSQWWLVPSCTLTVIYVCTDNACTSEKPENLTFTYAKGSEVNLSTLDVPKWSGHRSADTFFEDAGMSTIKETVSMSEDCTIYVGWLPHEDENVGGDVGDVVTLTLVYDPIYAFTGIGTPDVKMTFAKGTVVDMETLEIPDHENDEPVGWFAESACETQVTKLTLNSDRTLYAAASMSSGGGDLLVDSSDTGFYLSYQSMGGTYLSAEKLTGPTEIDFDAPERTPTKAGFVFTGWYTDFELKNRISGVQMIYEETIVVAGWAELVSLTIIYSEFAEILGGPSQDVFYYAKGDVVDLNEIEPKEWTGNIFTGWYNVSNPDATTEPITSITMDTDKTIFAGWTQGGTTIPTGYDLTFVTNEGTAIDGVHVDGITSIDLTEYTTTREGYKFEGWYNNEELSGSAITSITMTGSKTVYAKWEKEATSEGTATATTTTPSTTDTDSTASGATDQGGTSTSTAATPTTSDNTAGDDSDNEESDTADGPETTNNTTSNVPEALNGTDHIAYVSGYPDGTVRPENSITRAEVATILYRLLTEERRNELDATGTTFTDVSESSWYAEAVNAMASGGYITGYTDGTFHGDAYITRAEFVTIIARFLDDANTDCSFTDVSKNYWAYSYIAQATAAGWVDGYPDGTFAPTKNITRAEAIKIVNRVLNRGVDDRCNLSNFENWSDNSDSSKWYYSDVVEATNAHS